MKDFIVEIKYNCNGKDYSYIEEHGKVTGEEKLVDVKKEFSDNGIKISVNATQTVTIISAKLTRPFEYSKTDKIFVNGYQSWTDTKEFSANENLKDATKLPKSLNQKFAFDKYGDPLFKQYKNGVLHGYDISYNDGKNKFFISSKNTQNAFLIINNCIKENLLVLESDVAGLEFDGEKVLFDFNIAFESYEKYLDSFIGKKKEIHKIVGYTSWYNHYQDISEAKIYESLKDMDNRFNLFQIDDGFETYVGDWLDIDTKKFQAGSDSLKKIVNDIHAVKLDAGIWLAPFAAEEKSKVFSEHKDWLVKDSDGNPIKCGGNWSGFYALDFYNKDARQYIEKCLNHYIDLGFDFFKLDFLYAVNINPPKNKSRAEVAYDAYSFLRKVLKGKMILGCGATITTAFNMFEYMRIGPDVSLIFDDVWYMKYMHRERISSKVTMQNTVFRSFLDGRVFGCDPDVFLLRDDNMKMSEQQRKSLLVINSLFGSVMMTSDNIGSYDPKKKELMNLAFSLSERGKVLSYKRNKNKIDINAELDGNKMSYSYNTKTGRM